MAIYIFDIFHLNSNITQYLSAHDFFNCALVSKQWYSWFNPKIWESVDTKISEEKSALAALFRNNIHIQTVKSSSGFIDDALPIFPNLRSLVFKSAPSHFDEYHLNHFMSASSSMQKLGLTLYNPIPSDIRKITQLVKLQPNLSQLDLTICKSFESQLAVLIMEMLNNLDTLRLSFSHFPKSMEYHGQDIYQTPPDIEISKIQHLKLRTLSMKFTAASQEISILYPLLQRCSQLENLEICGWRDAGVVEKVIHLFQSNYFPHLRHFKLADVKVSNVEREVVSKTVEQLGFSRNGVVCPYQVKKKILTGRLETLRIINLERLSPPIAQSILEYHGDTLIELEISPNYPIQFQLFTHIAGNLPNLISLKVEFWIGPGVGSTPADEGSLNTAIKSNWKCLGLKKLEMTTLHRHEESYKLLVKNCANQLFNQIAKLHNLRELSFVGTINLLSASYPYLYKLDKLKELRYLRLDGGLDFLLGEVEAEWMLENWSRLIHVKTSIQNLWGDGLLSPGPQCRLFEKALLSGRPWIEIE